MAAEMQEERGMTMGQAVAEASRCLYCHDAPCAGGCPAEVDVVSFIHKIRTRNFAGAARVIRRSNVLGGICARVCPTEEQCQKECSSRTLGRPIDIGALQRFVCDLEEPRLEKGEATGKKVAVIGAGPSGLAAAAELNRLGESVAVFEAQALPGGAMTYAIPPYRLPWETIAREVEAIRAAGVEIRTSTAVGREVPVERLLGDYDAVFLGAGLGKGSRLGIPGEDLPGVASALHFLSQVNRAAVEGGALPVLSGAVAVIGGGNTAMDAARAALRLGASKATVFYRRSAAEMPAWKAEYEAALAGGVEFAWLTAPASIAAASPTSMGVASPAGLGPDSAAPGGPLRLNLVRMRLGDPDASGRRRPVPVQGSEFSVEVTAVITAAGQEPAGDLARALNLKVDSRGNPVVDPGTGATSNSKVFAGGDLVNGGETVVRAVAEGRKAAAAIHAYLESRTPEPGSGSSN